MSDFRNFDAWLTTDRDDEEAEERAAAEAQAWDDHCFLFPELDSDAADPQHPMHAEQYEPWLAGYWESIHEMEI